MPDRTKRINPMDVHIGQQIRIARISAGLSQEHLGEALGLTFQQVQKYEKGINRVSGSRLSQMVAALKLPSVDALFHGGPAPTTNSGKATDTPRDNAGSDMLATKDGLEFAQCWQHLTPGQRRAFLGLAESIVNEAKR
jgi:transcriptional regulator with XRE-family HTH domain